MCACMHGSPGEKKMDVEGGGARPTGRECSTLNTPKLGAGGHTPSQPYTITVRWVGGGLPLGGRPCPCGWGKHWAAGPCCPRGEEGGSDQVRMPAPTAKTGGRNRRPKPAAETGGQNRRPDAGAEPGDETPRPKPARPKLTRSKPARPNPTRPKPARQKPADAGPPRRAARPPSVTTAFRRPADRSESRPASPGPRRGRPAGAAVKRHRGRLAAIY